MRPRDVEERGFRKPPLNPKIGDLKGVALVLDIAFLGVAAVSKKDWRHLVAVFPLTVAVFAKTYYFVAAIFKCCGVSVAR